MNTKTFSLGVLLFIAWGFPAEDYSQWRYYRAVTINTTTTGANVSATQRNFPTLIRLTSATFDFSKAIRTGADVRFAKTNGVHLPYQIERWDSAAKAAEIWVLLDTVPGSSNRTFRMYYGKTGSTDSSKGSALFDTANGFQGVFHLAEATNDTVRDASVNRFKGVPHNYGGGNPKDTLGVIGHSKNFLGRAVRNFSAQDSGGNYRLVTSSGVNTFDHNPLNFQNDSATRGGLPLYSISAWINVSLFPTTTYSRKAIVSKSRGINGAQYYLRLLDPHVDAAQLYPDSNRVDFSDGPSALYTDIPIGKFYPGTPNFPPNTWLYLIAVQSGSAGTAASLRTCLNTKCFLGSTSTTTTTRSDYDVTIGSFSNDSGFFNGLLDEVRFENIARDSMWIRLNYWTQRPDSNAVMVGSETTVGLNPVNPAFKNAVTKSWMINVNGLKLFPFRVHPGASSVNMTVENMDGRVVWSRQLKADPNGLVFWNGKGENGQPVSPGMYVVRVKEER